MMMMMMMINHGATRISEVRKVFKQLASITMSIELRSQKKNNRNFEFALEARTNKKKPKLAFEHRTPIKLIPPTMRSNIEGSKNSIDCEST